MPEFNYLKSNSDFPHIGNVNTYKYDNKFDYQRYDATQMDLMICTVPWDMGEAHIGNRTISGIGNVVYFGSKANRDAWFDSIPDSECYRFTTKYKELHRDQYIDVPMPFDVCAKHNYLVVDYHLFANDNSPVEFETQDGVRKWFWFIREVEFLAPNTTRLHILDDAFQTWIYDVDVSGMVLERGHAPMFAMRAGEFLNNPLQNNYYLLTDDVNFGEASQVAHIDALALNAGTMYACIATTANPTTSWTNRVPASAYYNNDGAPSVYVFAVPVLSLNSFLANVTSSIPQFKQTVQGVFFASSQLLDLNGSFTFADTTCYNVRAGRKTLELSDLDVSQFGYSALYRDIAKLYTSPYAHIEVTDESGNVDIIKIEDTAGKIDVSAALSLAFPFITIDTHLLGVGGSAGASVTYRNIDAHTFNVSGQWYDTLRSWNVPTFAVVLDPTREYDYSTRFDRAQRVVDYTAAYNNEIASATAARDNANASATAAQGNENASAATLNANAALTITANTATTTRSNQSASTTSSNTQTYNTGVAAADNVLVAGSASSTISANEQQGSISAASGMAQSAVNAIGAAAIGNIPGAVTGVVNGAIGGIATLASTSVANGLTAAQAGFTQAGNSAHATASNTKTGWDTDNQTNTASDLTDIQNDLTEGTTANSAATQIANATRSYNAATGNATRSYNAASANASRTQSAAQSAIDNDIAQAALRAPFMYGSFSNGDGATTKPIALFAHIVTQSRSAIASAGDEFLRYGYRLDRQWEFDGNWNVGKYFTYWKLRDFWVSNLNVPDMYMDKLRFFLFGGVTVWRNPEDIGKRTVYENFNS